MMLNALLAASSCGGSLFNSYAKLMQNAFLDALRPPPPVVFAIDTEYSPGCLASSCGDFLFNSYSNLMPHALMAALPPPVMISY